MQSLSTESRSLYTHTIIFPNRKRKGGFFHFPYRKRKVEFLGRHINLQSPKEPLKLEKASFGPGCLVRIVDANKNNRKNPPVRDEHPPALSFAYVVEKPLERVNALHLVKPFKSKSKALLKREQRRMQEREKQEYFPPVSLGKKWSFWDSVWDFIKRKIFRRVHPGYEKIPENTKVPLIEAVKPIPIKTSSPEIHPEIQNNTSEMQTATQKEDSIIIRRRQVFDEVEDEVKFKQKINTLNQEYEVEFNRRINALNQEFDDNDDTYVPPPPLKPEISQKPGNHLPLSPPATTADVDSISGGDGITTADQALEKIADLRRAFAEDDPQINSMREKIEKLNHTLREAAAKLEIKISKKHADSYNKYELAQLNKWLDQLIRYRTEISQELERRNESLAKGTLKSADVARWRHDRLIKEEFPKYSEFIEHTRADYVRRFLDEKTRKHHKNLFREKEKKEEQEKAPARRREKLFQKQREKERKENIRIRLDEPPKKPNFLKEWGPLYSKVFS